MTDSDRKYLQDNYSNKSLNEISAELGIAENVLAMEARSLNLKKRNLKKFDDSEVEVLKQHYRYLSYGQLGTILKRNRTVIFNKIRELGLTKDDKDLETFKNCIEGYEDSIMFMFTTKNYNAIKIKKTIDILEPNNQLNIEMIESFLYASTPQYKKEWKLFGKII